MRNSEALSPTTPPPTTRTGIWVDRGVEAIAGNNLTAEMLNDVALLRLRSRELDIVGLVMMRSKNEEMDDAEASQACHICLPTRALGTQQPSEAQHISHSVISIARVNIVIEDVGDQ